MQISFGPVELVRKAVAPGIRVAASPAAWLFAVAWAAGVAMLLAKGFGDLVTQAVATLLAVGFLCWLTVLWTEEPPPIPTAVKSRSVLVVQAGVVIAIAVLVGLAAMAYYQVGPAALGAIPIWSGFYRWLLGLGFALPVKAHFAVSNPVVYFLIPLALLLLLGARWRELGFGPGHHTGRVLALWCAPQLAYLVILVIAGQASPLGMLGVFIRNGFQNGPMEEFLFRGALQTRLSLLMGAGWGLVLSSLAFGAWHVGVIAHTETGGDLIAAACAGIAGTAPFGLAQGVIFQRTRNLLAGSVFHMLVDLP